MENGKNVLSVSDITRQIKISLETKFPRVWIQGEISNFKQHTSGHLYFTLKDEGAQISGVMWRSRVPNLPLLPEDGMKVIVRGSITVYPPRGREVDALYIRFVETTVTTKHLAEGIAADYDADGRLAGIEILDAVKRLGDQTVLRQVILEDVALGRPAAAA